MKKIFVFFVLLAAIMLSCNDAITVDVAPTVQQSVINLPGDIALRYDKNPDFTIKYLGSDDQNIDYYSISPVPEDLKHLQSRKENCVCLKTQTKCYWVLGGGSLGGYLKCTKECVNWVCTPCINCYP